MVERGRPRSEDARRAVLDAALRLCERDGYQRLTIKAIAEEADVGRQTVYRWWPDKAEILMEALVELATSLSLADPFDTGDTLRDVRDILTLTFSLARSVTGPPLVGLMSDAQSDPALSAKLQSTVIGPRREALRVTLQRGVDRGELTAAVPLELVVDFVFGAMWYRLLSRHAPIDEELASEVTRAIARMLAPTSSTPATSA
jgi:AcrR family transcriptional regulator